MRYIAIMLIGSISGFLPLLPMMAVFHFLMIKTDRKNHRKTPILHMVAVYLFCFALVSVFSVTSIPSVYHMSIHTNTTINAVPFADLFTNFHQYALNVLLFVPIGFLLPMLWKKFEKKHITFLYGFFFSLSIEIIQLFNNRITDIDDLLTNTAGTIIGYFLFVLVKRAFPNISVFVIDCTDAWKWEPYFCFGFAWVSMLIFNPLISSRLLGFFFSPIMNEPGRVK